MEWMDGFVLFRPRICRNVLVNREGERWLDRFFVWWCAMKCFVLWECTVLVLYAVTPMSCTLCPDCPVRIFPPSTNELSQVLYHTTTPLLIKVLLVPATASFPNFLFSFVRLQLSNWLQTPSSAVYFIQSFLELVANYYLDVLPPSHVRILLPWTQFQ
jgi:hypothetical protein